MSQQRTIIGTLHRVAATSPGRTYSGTDLLVEVNGDLFLDSGVEFEGKIHAGHRVEGVVGASHAYVEREYPEVSGISGMPTLGAVQVVAPEVDVPGLLPVGTVLKLRVQ
jgi:hypothetical protein